MRMTQTPRFRRQRGSLNGLGQWEALIPIAASYLSKSGGGGGGGGGGGAMPISVSTTVSPTIQTQVSPQISPVFQQSYMPSNSGQTAGTSQYQPTVQTATGTKPGSSASYMPNAYGEPMPNALDPSMYNPSGVYTQPSRSGNKTFWIIAAIIAAAGIYLLFSGKKAHAKHSQSVRSKAEEVHGGE